MADKSFKKTIFRGENVVGSVPYKRYRPNTQIILNRRKTVDVFSPIDQASPFANIGSFFISHIM